jgi:histidinol-phosphate aminotransferase
MPGNLLLVLDQAYAEYVDPADDDGSLELAASYSNVLVTRTFSKAYGLAGERVGWGTGAPQLIEVLNRLRGPFNINNTAQATALAAMGDQDFVVHSREHNQVERKRFVGKLRGLGNHGLRSLPSEANFVLVLFEGALTAEVAYKGLAEAGYIVRWLPGQGLPHGLRITIGTREQMDAIARVVAELAEAAK